MKLVQEVYAFEGVPVNSLEAVDQALKAKYGRACQDWRTSKRNTKVQTVLLKPKILNAVE